MNDRIWHSGPPPHIGWWNASLYRDNLAWRWWDGKKWCGAVYDTDSTNFLLTQLKWVERLSSIEWTNYYPINARVPRIDPLLESNNG